MKGARIKMRILRKYYSSEDALFHVVKSNARTFENAIFDYDSFKKFAKAIKKDFSGADLLEFDFEGIDAKKYDFSGAKISSQAMIKLGIYDNSLFDELHRDDGLQMIIHPDSHDLIPNRISENFGMEIYQTGYEETGNTTFYISDIHLIPKLVEKHPVSINETEIREYCHNVAKQLRESMRIISRTSRVFILGDLSSNFKVCKYFFEELTKVIHVKIFFILGNHEYWDRDLNDRCENIDRIVDEYREMLSLLGVCLLHNDLCAVIDGKSVIFRENIINKLAPSTLREFLLRSTFTVLGGTGFSGLNNEFNSNHGIYRIAITKRTEDIEQSKRFERIYEKVRLAVADKEVIVATHMPKSDWTDKPYGKMWTYIWGHTHRNFYVEDEEKRIFADNQVGYKGTIFGFKHFSTSTDYNVFVDYEDGIHEITKDQYVDFYRGHGISFTFRRPYKKIYLLKKSGIFCFMVRNSKNELRLLNGGTPQRVGENDIQYFYKNLENYSTSIKMFMHSYQKELEQLSHDIKNVGGSGIIHGCIVDIDFYNHIYLNPFDGTKTPYFADSMTNKLVYKNIPSLLKYRCKQLYSNYEKLIADGRIKGKALITFGANNVLSNETICDVSTGIYKVSRIVKSLQYTTNYSIIRLWRDMVVGQTSPEIGRLLLISIIHPEQIAEIENAKELKARNIIRLRPHENKVKISGSSKNVQKVQFEKFKDKTHELSSGFVKLTSYVRTRDKSTFECTKCGYVWKERFDHFKDRHKGKCPKCVAKIL